MEENKTYKFRCTASVDEDWGSFTTLQRAIDHMYYIWNAFPYRSNTYLINYFNRDGLLEVIYRINIKGKEQGDE